MPTRWRARSSERLPEREWAATLQRVRAEFYEMPCLRVSPDKARVLFGLAERVTVWVLSRLADDGFLECRNGEYMRRRVGP
jgi:hypothetical protein